MSFVSFSCICSRLWVPDHCAGSCHPNNSPCCLPCPHHSCVWLRDFLSILMLLCIATSLLNVLKLVWEKVSAFPRSLFRRISSLPPLRSKLWRDWKALDFWLWSSLQTVMAHGMLTVSEDLTSREASDLCTNTVKVNWKERQCKHQGLKRKSCSFTSSWKQTRDRSLRVHCSVLPVNHW